MAKIKVKCMYCGKEIERYPSQVLNSVFCTRECRSSYNKENHTELFECDYCGEEKKSKES